MPRGGYRPGAGRKPGTVEKATLDKLAARKMADEILRATFLKHLPAMAEAQARYAAGLNYMLIRNEDGTFRRAQSEEDIDEALKRGPNAFQIHTQAPNTPAFVALSDRAIDKPIERTETDVSGELTIKWED